MSKQRVDIEKLLQWTYRDELPKQKLSSAEGIWNNIQEYGQRGGIDPGHGAAQRYAHFGLPDPDALALEKAVAGIEDIVVDWSASLQPIAGHLAGLVSVNDFSRRPVGDPAKRTVAGWTDRATGRWKEVENHPRDMLMLGAIRTKALVTMHASMGSRPDWREESPRPHMKRALKGPNAMVIGSCEGRNRYSLGSHCPLQWEPSPVSVILARAEYVAWWQALNALAEALNDPDSAIVLERHIALPPAAPLAPWAEPPEPGPSVLHVPAPSSTPLPLAPERGRMLAPFRYRRAGPVRQPLQEGQQ